MKASSAAAVNSSKQWYTALQALGQAYTDLADSGVTGCMRLDRPIPEDRRSRSGSVSSANGGERSLSGTDYVNPYFSSQQSPSRPYLHSNISEMNATTETTPATNFHSLYENMLVREESDHLLWQLLLQTTQNVSTYTLQMASLVQYSLFEPLQFVSSNQLTVAESCTQNARVVMQYFSTQSLECADDILDGTTTSASSTSAEPVSISPVAIDATADKIASATGIAHDVKGKAVTLPHQIKVVGILEQEWAQARDTRSSILVHQLKSFAKLMLVKVGKDRLLYFFNREGFIITYNQQLLLYSISSSQTNGNL